MMKWSNVLACRRSHTSIHLKLLKSNMLSKPGSLQFGKNISYTYLCHMYVTTQLTTEKNCLDKPTKIFSSRRKFVSNVFHKYDDTPRFRPHSCKKSYKEAFWLALYSLLSTFSFSTYTFWRVKVIISSFSYPSIYSKRQRQQLLSLLHVLYNNSLKELY